MDRLSDTFLVPIACHVELLIVAELLRNSVIIQSNGASDRLVAVVVGMESNTRDSTQMLSPLLGPGNCQCLRSIIKIHQHHERGSYNKLKRSGTYE